MDEKTRELLALIGERGKLPLVRFELRSSKDRALRSTALNHVWISDAADSMETVKARAAILADAVEKGWLTVDYALAVTAPAQYAVYEDSRLYADLRAMVEEGKKRPGFLFDTAAIKRGVAALTAKGRRALESEPV